MKTRGTHIPNGGRLKKVVCMGLSKATADQQHKTMSKGKMSSTEKEKLLA